jgi:uncharacterized membrane protein YcaP (DUF421 family)
MSWITGHWPELGIVAGKAALIYGVALVGLRLGQRRILARWSIIDFVTAAAIGTIVGRTAIASAQSFATGGAALITIVAVHRVASMLRFSPAVSKLLDHRVRLLVEHGRIVRSQLRRCGITENDLLAQLRQEGVLRLAEIRYVLYEATGGLTIVREDAGPDTEVLTAGLQHAAGQHGP